jgi:hypothetical protein
MLKNFPQVTSEWGCVDGFGMIAVLVRKIVLADSISIVRLMLQVVQLA